MSQVVKTVPPRITTRAPVQEELDWAPGGLPLLDGRVRRGNDVAALRDEVVAVVDVALAVPADVVGTPPVPVDLHHLVPPTHPLWIASRLSQRPRGHPGPGRG